jgi:hypothetical protein
MTPASHQTTCCHDFMAPWLIITGSGLDYWIYWQLILQSLVITINYKNSQSIISRTLLPWLQTTRSVLRLSLTLTSTRHEPRTENTALLLLRACILGFPRVRNTDNPLARWLLPSNGLGANHIENTTPVFLAACLFGRVYLATGFSSSIA